MASYIVTGKLGSGKSLVCVGKIFEYLAQGRKVATNLDIYLDKYLNKTSKKTLIRVPDKPTVFDLEALGSGNELPDEEKNGLLVLDELGSWFNSRSWQDKTRKPLLEWFIHARKHGWDTMLIIQDIDMLDGQLRGILAEHLVICKRLDRIKIPFIGGILRQVGLKGNLPKVHMAKVHYGESAQSLAIDKWVYRAHHLYSVYDTRQVFTELNQNGAYSLLSPWHTTGRYLVQSLPLIQRIKAFWEKLIDPPKVYAKVDKHPITARLMKLPDVNQRIEFMRRFEASGAYARYDAKISQC
jgi:hypothetical protein